jgi:hypothetical protein
MTEIIDKNQGLSKKLALQSTGFWHGGQPNFLFPKNTFIFRRLLFYLDPYNVRSFPWKM